jgi:hypothetical protein
MPPPGTEVVDPQLLELLRCPKCRAAVRLENGQLICNGAGCGLIYAIVNGIPNMIVAEARAPRPGAAGPIVR